MVTSQTDHLSTVNIRGLPITSCRSDDVRHFIADAITGATGICRIATINLNFLRLADEQPRVRTAILACERSVADGWPVLELARIAGHPLPERVTGASLVPAILGWAKKEGWRVALVGGLPETYTALQAHPTWRNAICGHWLPQYPNADQVHDPALCEALREARADIVLVALGCPKQELWLHANLQESGARAGIGIGGSLEFLAGVRHRAPQWIQALRLEFAFRCLQEPRRLGSRYLRDLFYWRRIRREAYAAKKLSARAPKNTSGVTS